MQRMMKVRKYARDLKPTQDGAEMRTMTAMFEQFMFIKKAEGLAPRTLAEYHTNLDYFMRYTGGDLTPDEMTTELFVGWIEYMLTELDYSPHTVNIRVRTMRAFVRYCYEDKGWISEPIHKRFKTVKAPIDNVEAFTAEEVKRIIGAIDDSSYTGFRTKVIVYILLDTMVRCAELCEIKRENVDLTGGTIYLEGADTKTRKGRHVPMSHSTIKLLSEYMLETDIFESDYLFLTYEGEKISANRIRENIAIVGQVAGITNKRVSPHSFRHSGALFYILNGGDPFSLQKILGHTHMNMVRRYIQMTNINVQTQHNAFSPLNHVFK